MKHLKITQPGWETYTGPLGEVEFDNGVSTEIVPRTIADRIAGLVMVELLDAEGNSTGQAGSQVRLIDETKERAPVVDTIERQSDADKKDESKSAEEKAKADAKKKALRVYTVEELEAVVDKEGITGLRAIGSEYGVKGRAITELMKEIMEAQARHEAEKELENKEAPSDLEAAAEVERIAAEKAAAEATEKAVLDAEAAAEAERIAAVEKERG